MTIASNLASIDAVNERLNEFAEANRIPVRARRQLNVVFDELLNNIISYGFDDEKDHDIGVDVKLDGRQIEVTIADDGAPFNPWSREAPDTTLSVEQRPVGGLGIHLVRQIVDEVSYERLSNRNVVRIVTNIDRGREP